MSDIYKGEKPVVFLFQVEDYLPVKADLLEEWEISLVKKVRFNPRIAKSMVELVKASTITATFSRTSPANGTYDDCDQD